MEVLVFGGSGFMGRATVRRFVEAGCDVTMANRGKCHWGESNPLRVNVMKCDRENPSDVVSVLKARQWKRPFYVFVSTDNVYNLSEDRLLPEQKEEMTRFAADPQLRQILEEEDSYGAGKLQVEQLLRESAVMSWSVRLPDVFDCFPVFVRNERELSFVFCDDVARCIVQSATVVPHQRPTGATNVADPKRVNLKDFLLLFAKCAGFVHEIKMTSTPGPDVWCEEFLPSVDFNICVSKLAVQLPQFAVTPLAEAVTQMANFYKRAYDKYPVEREAVLEEFPPSWRDAIRRKAVQMSDE